MVKLVRYTNEAIKRRKRAENILKRKINILIYIILMNINYTEV